MRACVRDPSSQKAEALGALPGVELVRCDSVDEAALAEALEGASAAYLCTTLNAAEAGRSTCAIREVHSALLRQRPDDVAAAEWTGLFEFVVWKLAMLVGPRAMGSFVHDLCHPSRFEQLRIETEHRGKSCVPVEDQT